jgi:hypothetical protein
MKLVASGVATMQILVLFATVASAVEPSADLGQVAAWIASQSSTDCAVMPWSREFVPPPQVTVTDRDSLEALSVDAARTPFERMAALALVSADDTQRESTIRVFFKETRDRIAPYHVHHVGRYLSALQPKPTEATRGMQESVGGAPRSFGRFEPADLRLLARMAILESDGMAMAALGLVGDERAAEVLVYAPFLALGGTGTCNANYQGLVFLCQEAESCTWVRQYLAKPELSVPRKAMVVLALAAARDPAASEPLSRLVQALTIPAGFEGDPRNWAHDPEHPILPPCIETGDVLDACGAWGEPRLNNALAGFIYAGSGAMEKAFIAAKACGVTLAKPQLLALAATPQPYWDANAVLGELTPLLEPDDAHAVASLLASPEWIDKDFYTRVLWLSRVPEPVLTPEVRDTLIAVAEQYPNAPVREWAIQALGRIRDPVAEQVLRQAEARGSQEALRILCEREPDASAAFLHRFADTNASVREAAYGLVQCQFFGSSRDQVPGGLNAERRAVILKHLLADWPEADAPPELVETAMQRLYILVVDGPLTQSAHWTTEMAADVVRCAERVLTTDAKQRHTQRLLVALDWAHTVEARNVVEQLLQNGTDARLREAVQKVLQEWKDSRHAAPGD